MIEANPGVWVFDGHDVASARQILASFGPVSSETILIPASRAQARAWSLSRQYGLEAFPWHTDGAVALRPPRYIGMLATHASPGAARTQFLYLANGPGAAIGETLRTCLVVARNREGRTHVFRSCEVREGLGHLGGTLALAGPCMKWPR